MLLASYAREGKGKKRKKEDVSESDASVAATRFPSTTTHDSSTTTTLASLPYCIIGNFSKSAINVWD